MGNSDYEVVGDDARRGGFASVRRVRRISDGKVFACKHLTFETRIYETRQNFRMRVEREIHLLNEVDHPNIVQYFEADWANDSAVMVYMEYVKDGNLSEYIEANSRNPSWPSEEQAWSFAYQLSAALAYCHHGLYRISGTRRSTKVMVMDWTQILHRDIKPRNGVHRSNSQPGAHKAGVQLTVSIVLLRRTPAGQVQYILCDFGLSVLRSPTDEASISYCGTRGYIAPEITLDHADWSAKADVYSFGCTLHYLLEKRTPSYSQHSTTSTTSVAEPSLHIPRSIQTVLDACLCLTPQRRPDSKDVLESATRHVDETVLALATKHEPHIAVPVDKPIPNFSRKSRPNSLDHVRDAVPLPARGHESSSLSQVDEAVSGLSTGYESDTSPPLSEEVLALAPRYESDTTRGKPKSHQVEQFPGSGLSDRSFYPNQIVPSAVSKATSSIATTTPIPHSQTGQNRAETQKEYQGRHPAALLPNVDQPPAEVHSRDEQTQFKTHTEYQEQRPTTLKPALKPTLKATAEARVPARVHFQNGQVQPGAQNEYQGQLPEFNPGAIRLPANVLFPDHARDDSMILNLTRSEKGFNFKTSSGRPVFKVRGMPSSSFNWNNAAMYIAGKRLLNLRQQGLLLWTTFFGDDPDGSEVFQIKCPATSVNDLKVVGSFLNANGIKETLVMTGDYYGRKMDIADRKTGMCVARIRQRQRGDRTEPLLLSLLLVSPTVDCVMMAAMCLLAYKITYSRSGLQIL